MFGLLAIIKCFTSLEQWSAEVTLFTKTMGVELKAFSIQISLNLYPQHRKCSPNKLQTSCGSQCLCCLKRRWVKERSGSDLGGERTVSVWTLSSGWHLALVLYQTADCLFSLCPSIFWAPEAGRWRLWANEEALTSHATFTHLKKARLHHQAQTLTMYSAVCTR